MRSQVFATAEAEAPVAAPSGPGEDATIQVHRQRPRSRHRLPRARITCSNLVLATALVVLIAISSLGRAQVEPPSGQRDVLTADELMTGVGLSLRLVHNDWFMPVGPNGPAKVAFSGTLKFPTTRMPGFDGQDAHDGWFPQIEVSFVSQDGNLIPIDGGLLHSPGDRDGWSLIVSPGRVWSEPTDGGLSRASFPFVLAGGRWWNEAHNGLATFVYDAESVSLVQIQIVQETAPENQFSAAGPLDAVYLPYTFDNAADIIADFERERASRRPVLVFAALDNNLSLGALRTFAGTSTDEPVSASGLIVDGAIYLRPCETRFGDFPYCEDMRHGVFSVTKSLGALVAMLRLAEKYGDDVFDLKIADYLTVTADHDGWADVTFGDALNMATGIGEASPERDGDEFWAEFYPGQSTTMFLTSQSAARKLRAAFSGGHYPWGPGEVFRYRNLDTFVLGAAMDSFLKRQEGPEADLWDMVTQEVLRPLGIANLPVARTIEQNGRRGMVLLVAGAYPTVHDIAKIAALLQDGGRHAGEQLLSRAKLAEALYQTDIRGLPVAGHAGESYHMSFWYFTSRQASCTVQVPRMDGWGGNLIELLPNGMTAFYLSDDFVYAYRDLADAAHEVESLCSR